MKERVQAALIRRGYLLTRLDEEGRRYLDASHDGSVALPAGAEEALRADNPRLTELRAAYDALTHPAASATQWTDEYLAKNLSLAWFRGDNAYVWQFRQFIGGARLRTYLALLDIRSRDRLGLLEKFTEDGLFGAYTFSFGEGGKAWSRDILDSVNEINYLNDRIGLAGIEGATILDIGAGYGRLAHRMVEALPTVAAYDCTDGVAVSTFLCEYYTGFRELGDNVRVVPLSDIDSLRDTYTVAVNIHSFTEQSHASICWWIDQVARRDVEWLLIAPNTPPVLQSIEADGTRRPFLQDVLDAGYDLVDERPVYESDELRDLIGVEDRFFLFRHRR